MAWLILGMHLYDIFTVLRLNNLQRGLFGGNDLSSILRNSLPILVFTFNENGGLNQVIFLDLFFLIFGFLSMFSNTNLWL